jgi:hypothetical protein
MRSQTSVHKVYDELSFNHEGKRVEALPEYYFFDHAIDLKYRKHPLWDLIYHVSKVKLRPLQEYINNILHIGKIQSSKLLAKILTTFILQSQERKFLNVNN